MKRARKAKRTGEWHSCSKAHSVHQSKFFCNKLTRNTERFTPPQKPQRAHSPVLTTIFCFGRHRARHGFCPSCAPWLGLLPAAARHQMNARLRGLDLRLRLVAALPMHMLRPARVHMQRYMWSCNCAICCALCRHGPRLQAGCARPPPHRPSWVSLLKPYC